MSLSIYASQWSMALKKCTKFAKFARYKIIQLKILHRAYMTPYALKKIDKKVSTFCRHNCGAEGTLMHLIWHYHFWKCVTDRSFLLNIQITLCPLLCLLGISSQNYTWKTMGNILMLGYLVAN